MSKFELPRERLATTDETGKRVFLYPAEVWGRFKRNKAWAHALLVAIFLIGPWVHWNGHQLIHLDVAHRKFQIFGMQLWAHDVPMGFLLMLSFALAIALITAIKGRVWCGWACPQTVFIEGIYRRIEHWVEGPSRTRKARDEGPLTGDKVFRKALKYFAYVSVSLVVAHSFLAYFVGSRELLHMVRQPPSDNWTPFLVVAFTTALFTFDFGWFREQFCVIMCPYGRFQSVLMDENSMIVGYDAKRGEPRRGSASEGQGDCVNCFRCVQVCPTGIDIRRGVQMECIACTACIDACDEVMDTVKKPRGLISYTTLAELQGATAQVFRPRTFAYLGILIATVAALSFTMKSKEYLEVTLLRAKEIPYQRVTSPDGRPLVINHFKVDLANQTDSETTVEFVLPDSEKALGHEMIVAVNPQNIPPSMQRKVDVFLRFHQSFLKHGHGKTTIQVKSPLLTTPKTLEAALVGPDSN